jgi:hypothetical protein
VPDRVARVEWTFPRERLPRLPGQARGRVIHAATVTARVTGNVAAARMVPGAFIEPSATIWFDAAGRRIRTFRFTVPNLAKPVTVTTGSSTSISGTAQGRAVPIDC